MTTDLKLYLFKLNVVYNVREDKKSQQNNIPSKLFHITECLNKSSHYILRVLPCREP